MNKLKIFSEKLGEYLDVSLKSSKLQVATSTDTVMSGEENFVYAWNNNAGSWVDKGWNNSYGSWQDKGWNNSYGSWKDKGWNNSYGSWQDKGWSNSYGSWGDSGGSSGGCYITSACVEFQGLSDDCRELEILRKYRDSLIYEDDNFRSKVIEYYRKAPLIVQQIDASQNKQVVYENLYVHMIKPCVEFLEHGKIDSAKELYLNYYEKLSKEYLEQ